MNFANLCKGKKKKKKNPTSLFLFSCLGVGGEVLHMNFFCVNAVVLSQMKPFTDEVIIKDLAFCVSN